MPLSQLQKYILRAGLESKKYAVSKSVLIKFYQGLKNPPKAADQIGIITKSVERLIGKGMVKGVGTKTAEKWFIKEVILTASGKKKARELLGKQAQLPFKIKPACR